MWPSTGSWTTQGAQKLICKVTWFYQADLLSELILPDTAPIQPAVNPLADEAVPHERNVTEGARKCRDLIRNSESLRHDYRPAGREGGRQDLRGEDQLQRA